MAGNRLRSYAVQCALVAATVTVSPMFGAKTAAQRIATKSPNPIPTMPRVTVDVNDAPLSTVLHTIAGQAGIVVMFTGDLMPAETRVTLHVQNMTALDAIRAVLRGTGLVANVHAGGNVTIVRDGNAALAAGTIEGRVTGATEHHPLRGAKVALDGVDQTETGEDGTYRLANVSAGRHTVAIKFLGYTHVTRTVIVQEGTAVHVDVMLTLSATPLDQVVVTGTIIPTELKAIPNTMTVITAKDLEQRGITHIDQLFRGDVPGLFAINSGAVSGVVSETFGSDASNPFGQVTMYSRGATSVESQSSLSTNDGTSRGTNPIKTYVDGVELADPSYLSQIDPKSIERIEILTGPQASTIYGSNALNGVMQIFTKRGTTSAPQFTAEVRSGVIQNNQSQAMAPKHRATVSLSGVEGHIAYNAGSSIDFTGSWTPSARTVTRNSFGGAQYRAGPASLDVALRLADGTNTSNGPTVLSGTWGLTGVFVPSSFATQAVPVQGTQVYQGRTLGMTLNYAPVSWWSQHLVLGTDLTSMESRNLAKRAAVSDSAATFGNEQNAKTSITYTTTLQVPLASQARADLTFGADGWNALTNSTTFNGTAFSGTLNAFNTVVTRQPRHNRGGFVQGQMAFRDAVFFTYGLRAEWNPTYGRLQQPNVAPRYGAAYAQDLGDLTVKVRASYGRSTRPPGVGDISGQLDPDVVNTQVWGQHYRVLPNPDLGPEHQQGVEGGLDMYLGRLLSLSLTRSNQTVSDLIASPLVDSIPSIIIDPYQICSSDPTECDSSGHLYYGQIQYVNAANIRNQSWELHSTMTTGPFTSTGTYSWVKSRSLGMTPRFAAQYSARSFPVYQHGATFRFLPEHTWALGTTYAQSTRTVSLNLTGSGPFRNNASAFFYGNVYSLIRLQTHRALVASNGYVSRTDWFTQLDVNASQRLSSHAEAVLQVLNAANRYQNDFQALYPVMGRQTQIGVRIR